MSQHTLKISGGPTSSTLHLELDGRPLYGVVAFSVESDVRQRHPDMVRATLVLNAQADVDVDLEAELLHAAPRRQPWLERFIGRARRLVGVSG